MIYNSTTPVDVGDSADIEYLSLVKLSTTTHGLDTGQRFIKLTESAPKTTTRMFVHTPKDGGIAPPGDYMLFAVSYLGVPSVAKYVKIQ